MGAASADVRTIEGEELTTWTVLTGGTHVRMDFIGSDGAAHRLVLPFDDGKAKRVLIDGKWLEAEAVLRPLRAPHRGFTPLPTRGPASGLRQAPGAWNPSLKFGLPGATTKPWGIATRCGRGATEGACKTNQFSLRLSRAFSAFWVLTSIASSSNAP